MEKEKITTDKNAYHKSITCIECGREFVPTKWYCGENKKVFCYCPYCKSNNKMKGIIK